LRTAREEQGKSLEDIGGELKIRTNHVLALEEGDFDKFDAPVFVRGFVRSYCRVLKIDSAPVVVQLNHELGGTDALASDPALSPGKKGFVYQLTLFLTRVNWSIWLPLSTHAFSDARQLEHLAAFDRADPDRLDGLAGGRCQK